MSRSVERPRRAGAAGCRGPGHAGRVRRAPTAPPRVGARAGRPERRGRRRGPGRGDGRACPPAGGRRTSLPSCGKPADPRGRRLRPPDYRAMPTCRTPTTSAGRSGPARGCRPSSGGPAAARAHQRNRQRRRLTGNASRTTGHGPVTQARPISLVARRPRSTGWRRRPRRGAVRRRAAARPAPARSAGTTANTSPRWRRRSRAWPAAPVGSSVAARCGRPWSRWTESFLLVTAAGPGACLAVLADADADLGMVAYEMNLLVQQVGGRLSRTAAAVAASRAHDRA